MKMLQMKKRGCEDEAPAELIVCKHVHEGVTVEVMLVADSGAVDFALCLECSRSDDPLSLYKVGLCRDCGLKRDIPAVMPCPGKWKVQEAKLEANS